MARPARWFGLGAAVMLVAACTGSPSVQPSSSSDRPSNGDVAAGPFPAGCGPIELRTPDGGQLVLDGLWVEQDRTDGGAMTWWIRALGDCVWGVGMVDDPYVGGEDSVQNLRGTLRPDFTIDSEIMPLGGRAFFGSTITFADVRFLIEFSEDEVLLREDRIPGEVGSPRCPDANNCLPPLVLVPADQDDLP